MDPAFPAALPQFHHAAGHSMNPRHTPERRAVLRTAWLVGALALAVYVGFYFLVGTAG